jgi:hypothetical protein
VARIILETDVTLEFSSFFTTARQTMTVTMKLPITGTDLWNQEPIESPGAAFDGADQDRSLSVDRSRRRDGLRGQVAELLAVVENT